MLTLTKVAETATTITLGWTPSAEYDGFVLYANGQVVSVATAKLKDGSLRKEAKFSKGASPYQVAAVTRSDFGDITVEWDAYPDPVRPLNVSEPTEVVQP